jgi:hypothetical protein
MVCSEGFSTKRRKIRRHLLVHVTSMLIKLSYNPDIDLFQRANKLICISIVRDLGVWIDSECSMQEKVSHTARTCFFNLRPVNRLANSSDVPSLSIDHAHTYQGWITATSFLLGLHPPHSHFFSEFSMPHLLSH